MNAVSWIILILVAAAAAGAVWFIIRTHRKGRFVCGGDCASCMAACGHRGRPEEGAPDLHQETGAGLSQP